MKVFTTVLKIVAAVIAVGAAIYAVITWGDKIVAWTRKLFSRKACDVEIVAAEVTVETEDGAVDEAEAPADAPQDEDFVG